MFLVGCLGLALFLLLLCLLILFHFLLELILTTNLGALLLINFGSIDKVFEGLDTSTIPETGFQFTNAWAFLLAKVKRVSCWFYLLSMTPTYWFS